MTIDYQTFQRAAVKWANGNFPQATTASKAEHLRREAEELQAANGDDIDRELADVHLLTLHLLDGLHQDYETVAWTVRELTPAALIRLAAVELATNPNNQFAIMELVHAQETLRKQRALDSTFALEKLLINIARDWGEPDAAGVVEHIEFVRSANVTES